MEFDEDSGDLSIYVHPLRPRRPLLCHYLRRHAATYEPKRDLIIHVGVNVFGEFVLVVEPRNWTGYLSAPPAWNFRAAEGKSGTGAEKISNRG